MPNRKTFDARERYDHSSHSTTAVEPGDLEPVPTSMRCVRIYSFGGPEVLRLEEVPLPSPRAGEILVRIHAASVNPVDYKIRGGLGPKITASDLPLTLGRDVSGTVAAAAEDVEDFDAGTEVFALLDRAHGGYADYVIVPAAIAVCKPSGTDFVASAAVPLAGITAWQGLFDQGGLKSGQRVLIHAGAGGVGHLAVQLAKARGAYVFATASGRDLEFVASLGADVAIDYRAAAFRGDCEGIGRRLRPRRRGDAGEVVSIAQTRRGDRLHAGTAGCRHGREVRRSCEGLYGGAQPRPAQRHSHDDRSRPSASHGVEEFSARGRRRGAAPPRDGASAWQSRARGRTVDRAGAPSCRVLHRECPSLLSSRVLDGDGRTRPAVGPPAVGAIPCISPRNQSTNAVRAFVDPRSLACSSQ